MSNFIQRHLGVIDKKKKREKKRIRKESSCINANSNIYAPKLDIMTFARISILELLMAGFLYSINLVLLHIIIVESVLLRLSE